MIDGMPSTTVTSRCTVFPPVRILRISALDAAAGIRNSPALIVFAAPKILARLTNASADLIALARSRLSAASVMLDPCFITTVISRVDGPGAVQPYTKLPPIRTSSRTAATNTHLAILRIYQTAFKTRLALVPPKPKLLLSTAFTLRFLATWGTRSTPSVPSSGLSRLSVGGTI